MSRKVFTVQEISDAWKVSPDTVNRLIASGKLPATKFGNQWRIEETDLNKYLKTRTTKKTAA